MTLSFDFARGYLQRSALVHLLAQMWSEDVVEVDPSGSQVEQILIGVGLHEVRAIELFVIGTVAAFNAAIVLLAAEGIAAQGAVEGLEETLLQGSDSMGVVSAELCPPIGLEGDGSGDAMTAKDMTDGAGGDRYRSAQRILPYWPKLP